MLVNDEIIYFLESRASLYRLKQDMVLFYLHQRPTSAVWLKSGIIQYRFDSKRPTDHRKPGLYFFDEFIREREMSHSAKVLAGSEIYLLTRSLADLLQVTA